LQRGRDYDSNVINATTNYTLVALPVLCVVFSIILIFLEQAAQEAEMFEKKKREAK